jgi:hypothetical protein
MIRYAVIVGLVLVVGLLADRLVRTENQRYALFLGSCKDEDPLKLLEFFRCLDTVQTRTAWVWHLYYGVTDPLPPVPISSPFFSR